MFKKAIITVLSLFMLVPSAYALSRDAAKSQYKSELMAIGLDDEKAGTKAEAEVDALIETMKQAQSDVDYSVDALDDRVDLLDIRDGRKDSADSALDTAKDRRDDLSDMSPDEELDVVASVAGSLPRVTPTTRFSLAEEAATKAVNAVNRVLIAPARPGAVPEGDIVTQFIPQLIRQLFRFAWLAVLISLTVSGVKLIMAHDDDEEITKAKKMIYYSMMGFAFIAFAFAIVKAVTDIDFFRFI